MGGTPVLDGFCSMDLRNNQPNNGVGGWGGGGEEIRTGGTRGGGRLVIVMGGKWSDEKKIQIDVVMGPQILMASAG
jgi:hypothetical protein